MHRLTPLKIRNKKDPFFELKMLPEEVRNSYLREREDFSKKIFGRRVAIVGHANKNFIESPVIERWVDVVVFVNMHNVYLDYIRVFREGGKIDWVFYTSGLGTNNFNKSLNQITALTRGDTLTHFFNISREEGAKRIPKWNEWPHFSSANFPNPDWQIVREMWPKVAKDNPRRKKNSILTGFIALKHILSFNPEVVYIMGWNLYNKYSLQGGGRDMGNHDLDQHGKYLRSLIKKNPRIILEERFAKKILPL